MSTPRFVLWITIRKRAFSCMARSLSCVLFATHWVVGTGTPTTQRTIRATAAEVAVRCCCWCRIMSQKCPESNTYWNDSINNSFYNNRAYTISLSRHLGCYACLSLVFPVAPAVRETGAPSYTVNDTSCTLLL